MKTATDVDVVVIGGGIAGLTAAAFAARGGAGVVLLEGALAPGGRGGTRDEAGFLFNFGAHALYQAGPAKRVLDALQIDLRGAQPALDKAVIVRDGRIHPMPPGLGSTANSTVMDGEAHEALTAALQRIVEGYSGRAGDSLESALVRLTTNAQALVILRALTRLTSYSHAPDLVDAKAMLDQYRLAFGGVHYLHGGWSTIVQHLVARAESSGAQLLSSARVTEVRADGARWRVARGSDEPLVSRAVILAVPPSEAAKLVPSSEKLRAAAEVAVPIHAACFDIGLSSLPNPDLSFALGYDAPDYYSVHTQVAELAPSGAALIHTARYLAPGERPSPSIRGELERLLDILQPGWRDVLVCHQWLPFTTVACDLPRATGGGLSGRCPVSVDRGLFVAGDWVGDEGLLSDAAFASGAAAGTAAAAS